MITKEFDAVELQREIRVQMHKEYGKNPQLRKKRLAAIRKKIRTYCKTERV